MDPPFSQHFVSDVGAFFVSQGVVMAAVAIFIEYRIVRTALAGYLKFAVLHLVFHTTHLEGMPTPDAIALTTALALAVVLPVVLLVVAKRAVWDTQADLAQRAPPPTQWA